MTIVNSVLELIGNTPILKLSKFDTGLCDLFIKMESENPGGSIKDRIAVCMIEAAEAEGVGAIDLEMGNNAFGRRRDAAGNRAESVAYASTLRRAK